MLSYSTQLLATFGLLLLCGRPPRSLGAALEPRTDQNSHPQMALTNGYRYSVRWPNGAAQHDDELVVQRSPHGATLRREGLIFVQYPDTGGILQLTYVADAGGFRVRYQYRARNIDELRPPVRPPMRPMEPPPMATTPPAILPEITFRLDATSLKTAAG